MDDPRDDTDVPSGTTDGAQMERTSTPVRLYGDHLLRQEDEGSPVSSADLKYAPGFWLVRAGRPLLHLSGSVFAYTYKMLASAALQRRILATSWHRCTG